MKRKHSDNEDQREQRVGRCNVCQSANSRDHDGQQPEQAAQRREDPLLKYLARPVQLIVEVWTLKRGQRKTAGLLKQPFLGPGRQTVADIYSQPVVHFVQSVSDQVYADERSQP